MLQAIQILLFVIIEKSTHGTHLRRNLSDWEIDELIDMLKTLEKYTTNPQIKDKLKWGNSKEGLYTIRH